MQLLIILALLLYGGKNGAQNLLSEVKPVLENIGGDEMREALKSAEEISAVLSAVNGLTGSGNSFGGINDLFGGAANNDTAFTQQGEKTAEQNSAVAFPLKPISNIADREITYSLSRYITG